MGTRRVSFLSLTFDGGLNEASGQNLAKMNMVDRNHHLLGWQWGIHVKATVTVAHMANGGLKGEAVEERNLGQRGGADVRGPPSSIISGSDRGSE